MICRHAQPEARPDYAICAINAAGPNHPHKSFCAACKLYDGPPRPVQITVPRFYSEADQAIVARHRAACESCSENGGLSVASVKCKGCGCAGLSLLSGVCKAGKW